MSADSADPRCRPDPVRRRILVAARHVALDRTSEGLCTARVLAALADAGHEVRCLTVEPGPGARPLGRGIEIVVLPRTTGRLKRPLGRLLDPDREGHTATRRLRSASALLVNLTTGHKPLAWGELDSWRRGLRHHQREFAPDLVMIRGGGYTFEAHLAMAGDGTGTPWIAHYHDPFPISAYPPSYGQHTPMISAREERANRRILRSATKVTFPSDRLADWTERSSGVPLAGRRCILPHIGGDIDDGPPDLTLVDELCGGRPFVLAHTGTLLRQRPLLPLLRAYRRVLHEVIRPADARLVLLGGIDRHHRGDPALMELRDELESAGTLRVFDGRTSHATALELTRRSTGAVLIEAGDPESPFFPAKLADYLALEVAVIALTPTVSVARDLLGVDHPLAAAPDDEDGISATIARLARAWADGDVGPLGPPAAARRSVAPEVVGASLADLIDRVVASGPASRGDR